jgi:hypothetical protein
MDGKPIWRDYLPEARAVLQAIHEPATEMMDAGAEIIPNVGPAKSPEACRSDAANTRRFVVGEALSVRRGNAATALDANSYPFARIPIGRLAAATVQVQPRAPGKICPDLCAVVRCRSDRVCPSRPPGRGGLQGTVAPHGSESIERVARPA